MKQAQAAPIAPKPFQTPTSLPNISLSAKLEQYKIKKDVPETPNLNNSTMSISSSSKSKEADPSEVFYQKKFQIIGFVNEERESIEQVLVKKGAVIVPSYDLDLTDMPTNRKIEYVDYTLFPLTMSVPILNNNPATVYWMKKCIEQNRLISLNENVFYQPIPRFNTDKPLTDCVITISGYGQNERDNIANICKHLGAQTQQSLSLKSTNDVMANTHLICFKPIGPKYIAAKSWNLPVVCAEWIVECCVMGMKADESKYCTENQELIQKDLVEALAKIRKQNEEMCTNSSYGNTTKANNVSMSRSMLASNRQDLSMAEHNPNDSSLTCHNESKKPRLDERDMEQDDYVQEESRNVSQRGRMLNDSDADLVLAAIENSAKFKKPSETSTFLTPCNPRLKELRRTEQLQPISPSAYENNTSKFSTPIWMKPESARPAGFEFKFKGLDCDRAIEMLKTPDAYNTNRIKKDLKKPETPLCELFSNAIHIASERSKNPEYWANCYESPAGFEYSFQRKQREKEQEEIDQDAASDEYIQPTPAHLKQTKQVLRNCKVYVSRKLAKCQAELYTIVDQLGGDFSWTYNQNCTHFIYSGKLSDNVKELKIAREDNKLIVGPEWIYACQEQDTHVDESQFAIPSGSRTSRNSIPVNVALEHMMSTESNDDVFLKENETNEDCETVESHLQENMEEEKTDKDQIDLKRAFLDQLHDKLASLKTSTSINNSKKIGRNKSDINKSDISNDLQGNENKTANFDDETALMQHLEFNDITKMNKNKIANLNDDDDEEEENFKRRQINLKRKANLPSAASMEKLDDKNNKSKGPKGIGKQGKFLDDPSSPSMVSKDGKNSKKFDNIAPSQIQVTYWKEDTNPGNLAPTQSIPSTSSSSASSKASSISSGRTLRQTASKTDVIAKSSKTDAIAERIVSAARAANSKKN